MSRNARGARAAAIFITARHFYSFVPAKKVSSDQNSAIKERKSRRATAASLNTESSLGAQMVGGCDALLFVFYVADWLHFLWCAARNMKRLRRQNYRRRTRYRFKDDACEIRARQGCGKACRKLRGNCSKNLCVLISDF
jgi:hypothetical protein